MIIISNRPTNNLCGLTGITGYVCETYPRFAIVTVDGNTFWIVHKEGRTFEILSDSFEGRVHASLCLVRFLFNMENHPEFSKRLTKDTAWYE